MTESSNHVFVRGVHVDVQTRCTHWHSPLDIIAIKFKCCSEWYACYECHGEAAGHNPIVWPRAEFDVKAIYCGACRSQLTVAEYLTTDSRCPQCGAGFNPGCANHYDLYFEM